MNKLAFLFPGQGSQHLGMLGDFAKHPIVSETFEQANDVLAFDLWKLCSKGSEEELNKTINTQPALLTASVALWRLWCADKGSQPAIMAGHSLGEYSALVCADALPFDQALRLVRQRGKYMQRAVAEGSGAMAAILGLGLQEIEQICDAIGTQGYVRPANINTQRQIVIAGYANAVKTACKRAMEAGAKKIVSLPVSIPSHCALMQPAVDLLAEDIASMPIKAPRFPVLHNVDAGSVKEPQQIKDNLTKQLVMPVRWLDTIQAMRKRGMSVAVECGPGRVLSGLNRSIDRELQSFPIGSTPFALQDVIQSIAKRRNDG